jgi:hypothetical protein
MTLKELREAIKELPGEMPVASLNAEGEMDWCTLEVTIRNDGPWIQGGAELPAPYLFIGIV